MKNLGNLVVSAFNANMLVEFCENGYSVYTYDANEDDYIPSSDTVCGYMDWKFLHQLERLGFTTLEA